MKCPRTGSQLKTIKVGGIAVDVSEECGGVFFDNLELRKFESGSDVRGEALAKHLRQFESYLLDEKERIKCPKCCDVVMMRRYYSPLKVIEIDECPACAGIWLDTGELDKIQNTQLSAAELARLRMEMVEQATPVKIEGTRYEPTNRQGNNSYLGTFFEIASSLFD